MKFYSGGTTERVRIDVNGKVGIGTTSPSELLSVGSSSQYRVNSSGDLIRINNVSYAWPSSNAGADGYVLTSTTGGTLSWTASPTGAWSITGNASTVDGTNFIGTTDNIPFNVRVYNEKAGRIDHLLANSFWGYKAGYSITGTGEANTFMGDKAGYSNTTGDSNTLLGADAGYNNTSAGGNSFVGNRAGRTNTTSPSNSAFGDYALYTNSNSDGSNSAFGVHALYTANAGYNSALGGYALSTTSSGSNNTAIGYQAGNTNTTGSNNTYLGYAADGGTGYSNSTAIGNAASINNSNDIVLGNSSIQTLRCQVLLSGLSDNRVKNNIQENVPGLEFIKALRPVTYHFDIRKENAIMGIADTMDWEGKYGIEKTQFTGFIAQEVELAANQIGYDFSGVVKPKTSKDLYSLRYSEFVVPLVKAIQEQQQIIEDLQAQLVRMTSEGIRYNSTERNDQIGFTATLFQNIPNPFGQQTVIKYTIPNTANSANIMIFDLNGNLKKTIPISNFGSGEVIINGRELNPGMFVYSLIVNDQIVDTKRMILTQ